MYMQTYIALPLLEVLVVLTSRVFAVHLCCRTSSAFLSAYVYTRMLAEVAYIFASVMCVWGCSRHRSIYLCQVSNN